MLTVYGSISTAVKAVKAIKEGAVTGLTKAVDVRGIPGAFDVADDQMADKKSVTHMSLGRLEWERIQRVLDGHDGNISRIARGFGMHQATLQRRPAGK